MNDIKDRTLILLMASNIVAGIPRQTTPDYQVNLAIDMALRMVNRYDRIAIEADIKAHEDEKARLNATKAPA